MKLPLQIATLALGLSFALPSFASSEVNQREANQQKRIAQGVQSGQLTPRETARLESREARIDAQVKAERAANGGKLTKAERRQVNREQNRVSGAIYRQKHDAQKR